MHSLLQGDYEGLVVHPKQLFQSPVCVQSRLDESTAHTPGTPRRFPDWVVYNKMPVPVVTSSMHIQSKEGQPRIPPWRPKAKKGGKEKKEKNYRLLIQCFFNP